MNGGISRDHDFKDGVSPGNPIGLALGLIKGFLAGLGSVFLRKLGKINVHFSLPVFYMGLMGSLFMPMIIIPREVVESTIYEIPPLAFFYLAMVGFCLALGQTFLNLAYKYEKASTVLLIGYTELILAIFSDLVIFESFLRWTDYLAAGLIFTGTFLIFLNKCTKS